MSVSNTVGSTIKLAIVVTDQNGHPMRTPVAPDSPPTWANKNTAAETLAATGETATLLAIAEGADEVDATAIIGGKTFSAALTIAVIPEPQVPSGIQIAVVP